MPANPNIYGLSKTVEMPSMLDSQQKASTLSTMALQQSSAAQEMQQKDRLRKMAEFGSEIEQLVATPKEHQDAAYAQMRQKLLSNGTATPDMLPEQKDPMLLQQYFSRWQQSDPYLEREKKKAEIANLSRKASGEADPLARQMAMMDYRDQKDQQKKQRELQQYSHVGGWQLAEGATPTADDAKKFKSGVSAARSLLENVNEYKNLVDQYGSEMGGKVAQRMDSLVRDIQLGAKNEDLYGLGVLTGPDLALLEEVVGSAPTGFGSKLNPFAGSKAGNKADQFRQMLNTRLNAKAKTYGFEPQADWQQLAAGGKPQEKRGGSGVPGASSAVAGDMPQAPKGMVLMQAPNGSMKYVSEAQKGEAIAAGGKVVR